MYLLPRLSTLEQCDFSIVETQLANYGTGLVLPENVRTMFDTGGIHALLIKNLEIAKSIPDYSGRSSAKRSLLIHQDHFAPLVRIQPEDYTRFLILSKTDEVVRTADTILMLPSAAAKILPVEEGYFKEVRTLDSFRRERKYDPHFRITEEQYERCFRTKNGYEEVVGEMRNLGYAPETTIRLSLLGYLIRGTHADTLMRLALESIPGLFLRIRLEQGDVLINDNDSTFHGRHGGNDNPLQRNFAI